MFNTLFWTGMRSGELLALTLNDINFEAKTISITKSYARIGGEDVISPHKNSKEPPGNNYTGFSPGYPEGLRRLPGGL